MTWTMPLADLDLDLARALLLAEPGPQAAADDAASIAAGVERVWTKLDSHFKRLVGDAGIRALLDRTVVISRGRVPWLVPCEPGTVDGAGHLRALFERQTPEAGLEGAGVLVTEFVALVGRFIGPALVGRLLHELWPDVFASASKELS